MSERRYDEAEVARIFEEATRRALSGGTRSGRALPGPEGLTLAQLQEIGAEVGLPPEAVAAGAAMVEADAAPVEYTGSTVGMPHGVAGSIPLPRELTDREWGVVVGRLRDTFAAHGTAESDGMVRSWRNGNLQIRIEPTSTGTVLRMRTHKSDGKVLPVLGAGMSGSGALLAAILGFAGDPRGAAVMGTLLIPVGVLMFMLGALTVPKWARTRKEQMHEIAAMILELTSRPVALPESSGKVERPPQASPGG